MSWGAWILILAYPLMMVQVLSTLRRGYPKLAGWLENLPPGRVALDLSQKVRRPVAAMVIPLAVALGPAALAAWQGARRDGEGVGFDFDAMVASAGSSSPSLNRVPCSCASPRWRRTSASKACLKDSSAPL